MEEKRQRMLEVMDKFGFIYADINLSKAHANNEEYLKAGFKTQILPKEGGFYIIMEEKREDG